ncbi:Tigger transposable element-derived protein 1 [Trichinella patagoniensis]|uniref:Tigger transposable element-derived protein 1 n=1 Tax=Trichinella patagoniensis TaxID=990121 RepID=A0A0V1AC80_9BILA|nr:Tigger transposable element-derived protein 1 [Trichinella patagoniensis]
MGKISIYFCQSVKRYCEEQNMEPKALLLLDNAPGHPENLESLQTCIPVEVVYLLLYNTSLLQLMDQTLILNFKAYEPHRRFKTLLQKTESSLEAGRQEARSILDELEGKSVVKDISELAHEVEIVVIRNNADLKQLAQLCTDNEATVIDLKKDIPVRTLTTEFLKNIITNSAQIMDQFVEQDTDYEQSSKARRETQDRAVKGWSIITMINIINKEWTESVKRGMPVYAAQNKSKFSIPDYISLLLKMVILALLRFSMHQSARKVWRSGEVWRAYLIVVHCGLHTYNIWKLTWKP